MHYEKQPRIFQSTRKHVLLLQTSTALFQEGKKHHELVCCMSAVCPFMIDLLAPPPLLASFTIFQSLIKPNTGKIEIFSSVKLRIIVT